jgi:exosortase
MGLVDRFDSTVSKSPGERCLVTLIGAALLWVYWPTFTELEHRWDSQSQYSHGYIVPLFSIYLLCFRGGLRVSRFRANWSTLLSSIHSLGSAWGRLPDDRFRPSLWGLPFLAFGLALRFGGVYVYFDWLAAISLLPCLAGACLLAGGWRALHWAWPAIAFLAFMIPLPHQLETGLSHPLQRIGTILSTFSLQTLGLTAYAEGNVIVLGEVRLGVVEACSGLSMLMTFFALSTAVVLLIDRSPLERAVIFLSAIPIALAANIIRIIVTAILHKTVGSEWADLVFHDLAGYLMPLLALGMLWLLLGLMSWVLVSPPSDDEALEGFGYGWGGSRRLAPAAGPSSPWPSLPGGPLS